MAFLKAGQRADAGAEGVTAVVTNTGQLQSCTEADCKIALRHTESRLMEVSGNLSGPHQTEAPEAETGVCHLPVTGIVWIP